MPHLRGLLGLACNDKESALRLEGGADEGSLRGDISADSRGEIQERLDGPVQDLVEAINAGATACTHQPISPVHVGGRNSVYGKQGAGCNAARAVQVG